MATDSEAWVRFAAAALMACEDARAVEGASWAADQADAMLKECQARQKRGDFGAIQEPNTEEGLMLETLTGTAQECGRLRRELACAREEAANALVRLAAMERERDEAREANKRLAAERDKTYEAMCAAQREWAAAGRERDEQRARAEAAERHLKVERDTCLFWKKLASDEAGQKDEAKSFLKEALGALKKWQHAWTNCPADKGAQARVDANDATDGLLSKAKAAGYISDGEATPAGPWSDCCDNPKPHKHEGAAP